MSVDSETLRDVAGRFPAGVTVISLRLDDGRQVGMTVSAFASLSLLPPLVLACIGDDATLAGAMQKAERFGVSVLGEEQESLSQRFADTALRSFDGVPFATGTTGVALVRGAVAHLECRVTARHRGGDHTIVIGEVEHAAAFDGRPLVHVHGTYARIAP